MCFCGFIVVHSERVGEFSSRSSVVVLVLRVVLERGEEKPLPHAALEEAHQGPLEVLNAARVPQVVTLVGVHLQRVVGLHLHQPAHQLSGVLEVNTRWVTRKPTQAYTNTNKQTRDIGNSLMLENNKEQTTNYEIKSIV